MNTPERRSDPLGARRELELPDGSATIAALDGLRAPDGAGVDLPRIPYAIRILLENLLRHLDGVAVTQEDVEALAGWDPDGTPGTN